MQENSDCVTIAGWAILEGGTFSLKKIIPDKVLEYLFKFVKLLQIEKAQIDLSKQNFLKHLFEIL